MWYIMGLKTDLKKVGSSISLGLCATITVLIWIYYDNIEDTTEYKWNSTLAALSLIASAVASGLSLYATIMAFSDGYGTATTYGRNFLSGLMLVFISLLYAFDSSDSSMLPLSFWFAITLRVSDIFADIGNPLEVQCDGLDTQKGLTTRDKKNIFVIAAFTAVLIFNGYYIGDEDITLDAANNASDRLLITVFVLVSVHLLLLIVRLIIQLSGGCKGCMINFYNCLSCKKDEDVCSETHIFMFNEIPLVSKLVFTANLVCMALLIGERIESNKPVDVLIWSITTLGSADLLSRNLI